MTETDISNLENGVKELSKILNSSYIKNDKFKAELYKILERETGNDNLTILCESVIKMC